MKSFIKIFLLVIFAFFCLTETQTVKGNINNSVIRCLETVIPSLYAMMIISSLLTKSGLISRISGYTGIFPPVFLFSAFAGYPVGIKILCDEYQKGSISKKQAEFMSGLCYGAGSAFINGCIAGKLYGQGNTGNIILISTVSANIILSIPIIFFIKKAKVKNNSEINISFNLLNNCITESGKSMAVICMSIVSFSVITAFLKSTGIISVTGDFISEIIGRDRNICESMIYTLIDITNAENLPKGEYLLLPFLCFVTSFGGLCVIFQLKALTNGKISLLPVICLRLLSGVLSGIICRLIMPFMICGEAVYVSVNMGIHKAESPVPSVMLILMTFFIFKDNKYNRGAWGESAAP
ncbi:MAG: hypothetical protein IKS03_09845 [Ruminococcus sp.]|nr:hypothetical protein [Ruminococcus sp.]